MRRIAYITPSGRPPHTRMSTTSAPMPAPKTHLPPFVTGLVTMSVAMKTAPSIKPPENSMNTADGCRASTACRIPANTATLKRMLTGVRQLRKPRHAR
jgi:hypothetical protein